MQQTPFTPLGQTTPAFPGTYPRALLKFPSLCTCRDALFVFLSLFPSRSMSSIMTCPWWLLFTLLNFFCLLIFGGGGVCLKMNVTAFCFVSFCFVLFFLWSCFVLFRFFFCLVLFTFVLFGLVSVLFYLTSILFYLLVFNFFLFY